MIFAANVLKENSLAARGENSVFRNTCIWLSLHIEQLLMESKWSYVE